MLWQQSEWSEEIKQIRPNVKELYYEGNLELLSEKYQRVAVVGSRRMSRYGSNIIVNWVPSLVEKHIIVVSGFMYGVDQTAHKTCVSHGGQTIAVLGWGIERKLSLEDLRLKDAILANNGLVVSEYGGVFEAQKWSFPSRNRIVAGISKLVLVIEAARNSGSLITANWAQKYEIPVMAVPGMVGNSLSAGTNDLIVSGKARAVTEVNTLFEVLKIDTTRERVTNEEDDEIINIIRRESVSMDELVRMLNWPIEKVVAKINERLIDGSIIEDAGKFLLGRL